MSTGNYLSASKVIQIVKCLQDAMENVQIMTPEVEELRQSLKEEMSFRFSDIENNQTLCKATACDPRFKTVPFSSDAKKGECRAWILKEMVKNLEDDPPSPINSEDKFTHSEPDSPEVENEHGYAHHPPTYYREDSLWASYDRKVASRRSTNEGKALDLEMELKRYLDYPILDRKNDPLMWWKQEGRNLFPNVAKVARKYLSIPATSVPSERVFSKCGIILCDRRTRLKPKYVNQLVS